MPTSTSLVPRAERKTTSKRRKKPTSVAQAVVPPRKLGPEEAAMLQRTVRASVTNAVHLLCPFLERIAETIPGMRQSTESKVLGILQALDWALQTDDMESLEAYFRAVGGVVRHVTCRRIAASKVVDGTAWIRASVLANELGG